MTSSLAVEPLGAQRPRLSHIPEFVSSAGLDAIEVGRLAGLVTDPWQEYVLLNSLGELADGTWAAPTVCLVIPRQNGKNFALMIRELAGVFAFGEKLIIHSAHEQKTAVEHFRKLLAAIESVPEFDARVLKVSRGKGSEAIELRGGQRILFNTRSGSAFRGYTADCIVFDEAMVLSESTLGAMGPTLSANSMSGTMQLWWTGSAVDELNSKHDGIAFSRVRDQGLAGHERVAFFEWSAPFDDPDDVPPEAAQDLEHTRTANPGLGIRISEEWVEHERTVILGWREFLVERWGVGCWPSPEGSHVISGEQWEKLMDPKGKIVDPACFSYDVSPDRAFSSISAGGARSDGLKQVETIMEGPGTGWIVPQLVRMHKDHHPVAVVCDGAGPAGSLIAELEQAGVPVTVVSARDHGQACGMFYDHVVQEQLRHLGTPELRDALRAASRRQLGDAWAWDRKKSTSNITSLVSATLALWGHLTNPAAAPFMEVW